MIIPKKKVTVQKDLKSASSSFKYPSMIEQQSEHSNAFLCRIQGMENIKKKKKSMEILTTATYVGNP